MNCKPGDLARVVRASEHYGKIVRVLGLFIDPMKDDKLPAWVVDPTLFGYVAVYDTSLRPIADPKDDEQDCRDILVDRPVSVT